MRAKSRRSRRQNVFILHKKDFSTDQIRLTRKQFILKGHELPIAGHNLVPLSALPHQWTLGFLRRYAGSCLCDLHRLFPLPRLALPRHIYSWSLPSQGSTFLGAFPIVTLCSDPVRSCSSFHCSNFYNICRRHLVTLGAGIVSLSTFCSLGADILPAYTILSQ